MSVAVFFNKKAATFFQNSLLIRSRESKTIENKPVLNEIKWFKFADKDIWMMNQSHDIDDNHFGKKWDRLAIVIDKKTKPMSAQFFQLKPGPLEWSEDLIKQQVAFKVSCFMCHANGLRVIRPTYSNWLQTIKTFAWNLKIKSYGRVIASSEHTKSDQRLKTPFRHQAKMDNEKLQVKLCLYCHKDSGIFARGFLTRQNFMTIKFMVDNKIMPPLGIPISNAEKLEIKKFIEGL